MTKRKPLRILSFDTSLSSPGAAVIEVATQGDGTGKAKVIAVSHVKTKSSDNHAQRTKTVNAWAYLFIGEHAGKGFDYIVREDFRGRSSRQNHPVHSAWHAIDDAIHYHGLTLPIPEISQSSVKKAVVGRGKAEKDEVAEAVRKLTGYKGEFAADDESDAAAVGLAYAIQQGLITKGSD